MKYRPLPHWFAVPTALSKSLCLRLVLFLTTALCPLQAQLVADGATNTLVNVASNLTGTVTVGTNGSFTLLILSDDARLTNSAHGVIGLSATARSNEVRLTGATSRWVMPLGGLFVGSNGSFNRLVVNNGALVQHTFSLGALGQTFASSNNEALVTGSNSLWNIPNNTLSIGSAGGGNRLVVSNGGAVRSFAAAIGSSSRNNDVWVTGPGSYWTNPANLTLSVSAGSANNRLVVSNGGAFFTAAGVTVGDSLFTSNSCVVVDGGLLRATNATVTGFLDVRRGTNVLDAGWIDVDRLLLTNTQGFFQFNGGTVSVRTSTVNNAQTFLVGNGTSAATLNLGGNGTHSFANQLFVAANATLTGNGSITGLLVLAGGGTLAPGSSIGKISLSQPPVLLAAVIMEISKDGAALTNDQIQVTGTLNYGGSLTVTNVGPGALAAGDRFQLFNASAYAGSFTTISLPPLAPGLSWRTNLLVDGSIEVLGPPAILLSAIRSGSYTQNFDSLAISGGANLWRDNLTLPGWYAAKGVAPFPITHSMASDGSANNGSLYSFGSSGSTDRALGSIASDTVGTISYGLGLANDTAGSVSNFTIRYTGEQWRSGNSVSNTLTFWYRVSASAITNPEPDGFAGWTQVEDLDFASPNVLAPNTALDGNLAANRRPSSSVLIPGLVVPTGQNVFFRWRDVNEFGANQGMALDDLIVAFSALRPRLTIISTNGIAQLTGLGESNVTYGIEAASNLNAPILWERLGSNTANGSGVFQFSDTNAPLFPWRFYRALFP